MYILYNCYVEYCIFHCQFEFDKTRSICQLYFSNILMANKIALSIFCISLIACVQSFVFNVEATKEECFFEVLAVNSPIGIMFQVIQGGFLDIDIEVNHENLISS